MASRRAFRPNQPPQPHASPYCTDPNCQTCKDLNEVQEAIRLHQRIPPKNSTQGGTVSNRRTLPMLKHLRVLTSCRGVPVLGECIRCNQRFKAHNDSDRNDILGQFDVHVCSVEDVRRTAMRIVSRAGLSFFSS